MANNDETFEHFCEHGWMRVRAAFSVDEAAAMRTAAWRALANDGITRSDPSTWTKERPEHLQHAKHDPAFQFLAFPSNHAWTVHSHGWHIDANYVSALSPPAGLRTHALLGDVAPRAGGTLIVSGSHRLVHKYFKDNPPPPGARGADYRRLLQGHPYFHDLHTEGDADERVVRFMDHVEEHDGTPLQVVENTGAAGDVIVLHPLVLHVATSNTSNAPRFLLSGGVDLPSMWTA